MALKPNGAGLWVLVLTALEHRRLALIVCSLQFIHCAGETNDISRTVVKTKATQIFFYIKRVLRGLLRDLLSQELYTKDMIYVLKYL